MSGILGVVHLDGAPVDGNQLRKLTEVLAFRGPDAQQTWHRESVGFGHTWLRTSRRGPEEVQPFALDDRAWIVADARLDAREELIDRLEGMEGRRISRPATDVELLGRAYRAWGERCVDHLLGDFAFAVWDEQARHLFLARDQLGVKPLYYAHLGPLVVFSNTLACVRTHPRVSRKLNDLAIADYLVFDMNHDAATTSFADVRRLPPGHHATFSAEGARVARYWRLPADEPIRYRRAADYEEHFRELVDSAVRDRLPDGPLGICMSGGLDSGMLAARACGLLRRGGSPADVRAFTVVWEGFDQDERRYAGLTASFLGIPVEYHDLGPDIADPSSVLDRGTPEPLGDPSSKQAQYYRALSEKARVFLYGEGPDNLLRFEWRAYIRYMLRRRQPGQLALDFAAQAVRDRARGWLAPLGRIVRQSVSAGEDVMSAFPTWLDPGLERRLNLRDRWRQVQTPPTRPDAMRPLAHATSDGALWGDFFAEWDCENTAAPFEMRHPFLDLRVVRYLLAVPTVPWCRSKSLLRRAMLGRLPDQVLRRKKAALLKDPFCAAADQGRISPLNPRPEIEAYVKTRNVPVLGHNGARRSDLRPYMLDYWLRRTHSMVLEGETV